MDVREQNMNEIIRRLTYLKTEVSSRISLNLTDISIHAENTFRDLLNLIYGLNFENINYETRNADYIDLIDKKRKRAIQVTCRNDNDKIDETIKGFFKNPSNKEYRLEVLLISKDAKNYKTDFTHKGIYSFDHRKDVIDIKKLITDINNKSIDEIIKIAEFLEKEILMPRPKTESNEVETIMSLLEWLSDDKHYKEIDKNYECDPDKKINNRFKEYSNRFKEEFTDLYAIYCMSVTEAKKSFGLDGVRAKKISTFLITISNRFLREENDDPLKALDKLTDYFEEKIKNNGIKADICAIRYYLLDELIGCNIFSEEVEIIC